MAAPTVATNFSSSSSSSKSQSHTQPRPQPQPQPSIRSATYSASPRAVAAVPPPPPPLVSASSEAIIPTIASTAAVKPACSTCPTHLLNNLKRDGYVHIPALVDPCQLSNLRAATLEITKLAREGRWSYIHTVPKQSPPQASTPSPASEGGIWGVQHLLHPSVPSRKEFAKLYFGNRVIAIVKELLGLNLYDPNSEEKIVMEVLNLLVSPSGEKDFELPWHRDGIAENVDACDEKRQLNEKSPGGRQSHVQYNIALSDADESLLVIPGSHRRVRTDIERNASPYEFDLPDQVAIKMKAGDAVFYDDNILHRLVLRGINLNHGDVGTMTLHGSVGRYGHADERAKKVLRHGVGEWIDSPQAPFDELQGKCRARAEGMRSRLVEMGQRAEVEYALDD